VDDLTERLLGNHHPQKNVEKYAETEPGDDEQDEGHSHYDRVDSEVMTYTATNAGENSGPAAATEDRNRSKSGRVPGRRAHGTRI
jgi:hypothetical protein